MPEPALTLAALKEAADELAYLRAPVEAKLSAPSLSYLRLLFAPDPTKDVPPPTPFDIMSGVRLVLDNDLPFGRMEFRDADGEVVSVVELPQPPAIAWETPEPRFADWRYRP